MSKNLSDDLRNNLLDLENKYKIKLFKKHKDYFILRDKNKIINDCNNSKKKNILTLSNDLKNISTGTIDINQIKNIQNKTILELMDIDNIINIMNNIISDEQYIEIYEN